MIVAVIGSRTLSSEDDYLALCRALVEIEPRQIVSGGARGADALGARYAREHGLPLVEHLPDYNEYGKKAPLMRNWDIVSDAEVVVALWDGKSTGTAHALKLAQKRGKKVVVVERPRN